MFRKEHRLKQYDYSSSGSYFITVCVNHHEKLLGEVMIAPMQRPNFVKLSSIGAIVKTAIEGIALHYPGVVLEKYVIMPNHIHLLLRLGNQSNTPSISVIINQMKGYVSKQLGICIWQKLYHDRVVRNEAEYLKIWHYIDTNPWKWEQDCYYPPIS